MKIKNIIGLALLSTLSWLLVSCNEQDPDPSKDVNFISYEGVNYAVEACYAEDFGCDGDHYRVLLWMYDAAESIEMYIPLYSLGRSFDSGTYVKGDASSTSDYWSDANLAIWDDDQGFYIGHPATSGTVEVRVTGENTYDIDFDFSTDEGPLVGNFKGQSVYTVNYDGCANE